MPLRSKHSGFDHPRASEITPRALYEQRRALLRLLAAGAGGAALASGLGARRWPPRGRASWRPWRASARRWPAR